MTRKKEFITNIKLISYRPAITIFSLLSLLFTGGTLGFTCDGNSQDGPKIGIGIFEINHHQVLNNTDGYHPPVATDVEIETSGSDTDLCTEPKKEIPLEQPNSNEFFPIEVDRRWGYINIHGKVVIEPKYLKTNYFSEGLGLIQLEDYSYGFINTRGEIVISDKKEGDEKLRVQYGKFSEGLAPFKNKDGKWGFINQKGDIVIAAEYFGANPFSEGFAVVNLKETDEWRIGDRTYIDKVGKKISDIVFKEALDFSDGLGAVNLAGVHGNWGFIDKKGKFVIEPQFGRAFSFSDGLARVMPKEGGGYGYINKSGKYALGIYSKTTRQNVGGITIDAREQTFGAVTCFNDGVAPLYEDGGWYIYGSNGKRLTKQIKCHSIGYFSEGLAAYIEKSTDNIKFGVINSKGTIIVKPLFNDFFDFKNGLAFVKDDQFQMYIDKKGKVIWKNPLKK